MSTITTRSGKGSALTHTEMDNNFTNLNTDKVETKGTLTKTFANNETAAITLSSAMPSGHIPVVSVTKAAVVDGLVESSWDVNSTGSNYDIEKPAANTSVTLTSANVGTTAHNFVWDGNRANTAGDLANWRTHLGQTGSAFGRHLQFYDDGNYLLLSNSNFEYHVSYQCTTPYDPSTAVYANTYTSAWASVGGYANYMTTENNVCWNRDGTKLWVVGDRSGTTPFIAEYSASTAWDLSTSNLTRTGNTAMATEAGSDIYQLSWVGGDLYMHGLNGIWRVAGDTDGTDTLIALNDTTLSEDGRRIFVGWSNNRNNDQAGGFGHYWEYGVLSQDLTRYIGHNTNLYNISFYDTDFAQNQQRTTYNWTGNADWRINVAAAYRTQVNILQDNPMYAIDNTWSFASDHNNDPYGYILSDPTGNNIYIWQSNITRMYKFTCAHADKSRFDRSAGSWTSADVGKIVSGNGGKAIITGTDGSYKLLDAFDNTNPLTSWSLDEMAVKSEIEGFEIANQSRTYDISADYGYNGTNYYNMKWDSISQIYNGVSTVNNEISYTQFTSVNDDILEQCWANNGYNVVYFSYLYDEFRTLVLENPYDLVNGTRYTNTSLTFDPNVVNAYDPWFSEDGLKFSYRVDDDIFVYTLDEAWNIGSSNSLYSSWTTFTVNATTPTYTTGGAMCWKKDGTKLWTSHRNNNYTLGEWDLSTAWDLSTRTFNRTVSMKDVHNWIKGSYTSSTVTDYADHGLYAYSANNSYYFLNFEFSDDGTQFKACRQYYNTNSTYRRPNYGNSYMYQIECTTPWDLSSVRWYGKSITRVGGTRGTTSTGWTYGANWRHGDGTKMIGGGGFGAPDGMYVKDCGGKSYSAGSFTAITNSGGQIDTSGWTDINSVSVTETAGSANIYYCYSIDNKTTWKVISNTDGERSIARNNSGTWQYNDNNTYGTTNWVNSTVNDEKKAIQQALGVTANQMDKTQFEAVTDANHITTGSTLDLAMTFVSTSTTTSPTSDGVSLNYAGNSGDQGAILGTDYNWKLANTTTVEVTALAPGNLKVRIV